jgi:hypothetical protein
MFLVLYCKGERDGEKWRHRWEEEWMPAEEYYVKMQKPYESADIIIDGSGMMADISLNQLFTKNKLNE